MFIVGSALLSADGFMNISPKGMDSFRILNSRTVAHLDHTGSGIESVAHVKENGRFVIMFCSFDKTPLILRLHGKAVVVERAGAAWDELQTHFPQSRMVRSIIKVSLDRIADSYGWGVPMYEFIGERSQYWEYDSQTNDEALRDLQMKHNMKSIDDIAVIAVFRLLYYSRRCK